MPSDASPSDGQGLSAAKAVVVGHLVVTGPVLAIIAIVGLGGYVWFGLPGLLIGGLLGCGVAWIWWSWTVPKLEAVGAKSRCLARPRAAAGCSDGPYMAKRMDLRAD